MDRLPTLIIVVALAACDSHKAEEPPSRVNAAKVGAKQAASTDAFCDVHTQGDSGPQLQFPALVGDAPGPTTHWRWLNIWATWCKPCVEELPRLLKWRDKLAGAGTQIDLAFVSIDESDDDIGAFRKLHPDTPASPRLADVAKQADWFHALGLDGNPPIPIHVFVAPSGHIRCARAGGVREQDYAAIERLLAE